MFKIIMIDDDHDEFAKIRRTIKSNAPEQYSFTNKEYDFIEYDLSQYQTEEEIVKNLIHLIRNKSVSLIIIDYKLLTKNYNLNGNIIFSEICQVVSKFPVVILTEKLNESLAGLIVDADKIYEKNQFFKLESEYANEKVTNLFYNMEAYLFKLRELEDSLNLLIGEMQNTTMSIDLINKINELETELSKLIPLDHCQAEEICKTEDLKEIINLLAEANKLIEG